ncbi:MAG: recombinase family protein [Moheibacter sp.]
MLGIYTRLSVLDDASNSINNQQREGIAFADKMNLEYQIYNEGEGVSGTNEIADRPQLHRLMEDISSKKITHVWFRNQNRLERSSATFHLFADQARKNNINVYFNDKLEDWDDPSSFLKSSILTALNQYQTSLQSKQTKKALLDNVREGKSFGIYPYGYKSNKDKILIIDDDEAEIVKLIYQLSLSGKGTRSIAELLNKKGVLTRYNKIEKGTITVRNRFTKNKTVKEKKDIKWSGNSVRGIIINTIYKGERKWKDKIYPAPAIFDKSYWEEVNNNLTKNRNNTGKKVKHKYLLKGLLECGVCGRNMYGRTRISKKDNYYMCSSKRDKELNCGNRSINIDFIELYLWNLLFYDSNIKKSILNENKNEVESKINQLTIKKDIVIDELKKVEKEKKRTLDIAVKGYMDDEELDKRLKQNKLLHNDLTIKLSNIEEEINFEKESKILEKSLKTDLENVKKNTPFNKKQELLNKYIFRVKVYYNKEVNFYFLKVYFKLNHYTEVFHVNVELKDFRKYVETGYDKVRFNSERLKRTYEIGMDIKSI